jgi:hypothetical protein
MHTVDQSKNTFTLLVLVVRFHLHGITLRPYYLTEIWSIGILLLLSTPKYRDEEYAVLCILYPADCRRRNRWIIVLIQSFEHMLVNIFFGSIHLANWTKRNIVKNDTFENTHALVVSLFLFIQWCLYLYRKYNMSCFHPMYFFK